jgi:hypothetical protein
MASAPPSGPDARWPAVAGALPAGLATVSGHPVWGVVLAVLVPTVHIVLRDYLRPLLRAGGVEHPRRLRRLSRVKTELRVAELEQRGRIARVRNRGTLEREKIKEARRTRELLAKAGGVEPGRANQLHAVSAEEEATTARRSGRHRDAG